MMPKFMSRQSIVEVLWPGTRFRRERNRGACNQSSARIMVAGAHSHRAPVDASCPPAMNADQVTTDVTTSITHRYQEARRALSSKSANSLRTAGEQFFGPADVRRATHCQNDGTLLIAGDARGGKQRVSRRSGA
jgi:hypothetical protein